MVLHRVGSAAGFTACASSNLALSASFVTTFKGEFVITLTGSGLVQLR